MSDAKMEILNFFDLQISFHNQLLYYIEDNDDDDNTFSILINILKSMKLEMNPNLLNDVLHLLSKFSKHHHRYPFFFRKIEKILFHMKDEIKRTLSNFSLFKIFKTNKRMLFFLFKEKFIEIDQTIADLFLCKERRSYCQYFRLEIKSIKNDRSRIRIENFDLFDKNREIGENESYICQLIRADLVEEFVSHVTRSNMPLWIDIEPSIFETNSFLLKNKKTSLIEYSAFYGSIQIFQYLRLNKVELTSSLWMYAIHSDNAEMIHLLEEYHVSPPNNSFEIVLNESIKCHHNSIANYIAENVLSKKIASEAVFHYYNYMLLPIEINSDFIYFTIKFNYIEFIEFLLQKEILFLNTQIRSCKAFKVFSCTVLQLAVHLQNKKVIDLFLSYLKDEIIPHAFEGCYNMIDFAFPSTITKIGEHAFNGCVSLRRIVIPSSVTEIKPYTFKKCNSLVEVSIPFSVTSIGASAFEDCKSLKEIMIPSSVIDIGQSAFKDCSSMMRIMLPLSLKGIEPYTFNNCSSLNEISIPDSVERNGWSSFSGCSSLEQVVIPSSVKAVDGLAFSRCSSLKKVKINSSLPSIEYKTFFQCKSLTDVNIPSSVTAIRHGSFCECSSLYEIEIPPNVVSIESYVFSGCSSLNDISIPFSVESIGHHVFSGCHMMKQIIIPDHLYSKSIGVCEKTKIVKKTKCFFY